MNTFNKSLILELLTISGFSYFHKKSREEIQEAIYIAKEYTQDEEVIFGNGIEVNKSKVRG